MPDRRRLTHDELYGTDFVEVRFPNEADARRADERLEFASRPTDAVRRIRSGWIVSVRAHLDALGIVHDEHVAAAA